MLGAWYAMAGYGEDRFVDVGGSGPLSRPDWRGVAMWTGGTCRGTLGRDVPRHVIL